MDPFSVGLAVLGIEKAFDKATSGVAKWRSGKATAEELGQLAVRYLGCVAREFQSNAESLALAAAQDETLPDGSWPVLDFTFADALMSELARIAPLPDVVVGLGRLVGMQRQLAVMADLDRATASQPQAQFSAPRVNIRQAWISNARALAPRFRAAIDLMREWISTSGRQAFGVEEWAQIEPSIVPPIDPP